MPRERSLNQRVRALERSLTTAPDGPRTESVDGNAEALGEGSGSDSDSEIEARLSALEAEVAELSAGLQALRGYVGNIDHVNESIERRANAAMAAVERLESATTAPPLATIEQSVREGAEPAADRAVTDENYPPSREGDGNRASRGDVDGNQTQDPDTDGPGLLERLALR